MIYFSSFANNKLVPFVKFPFAFLEPSGNLSVFTDEDTQPVLALISRWRHSKQTY